MKSHELATFNDAITIMRLIFDEQDDNNIFIENALWAAEKKLFRVTIPIDPDAVNPVITRKEFSYWLCRITEIGGKNVPATKNDAYKRCVSTGIVFKGRGPDDSFTGTELLDTFAYFDYYIRTNKVKLRYENIPLYDDDYNELPDWRKKIYQELDSQREYDKKIRKEKKQIKKQKKNKDKAKPDDDINVKVVE